MTIGDMLTAGLRNSFIVIGFVCMFFGLIVRQTGETGRGLGMALVVVGALMAAFAILGRLFHWW